MNLRRLAPGAAIVAALGLVAAPARADLGPGLRISLTGITGPATAGEPVSFGVLIETGHEVVLSGFQLSGGNAAGTGTVATGLPTGRFTIAPGSPSQFTITTTPSIANPVYRLRFSAGSRLVDHYFDLSRAHFDRMSEPQLAAEVGDVPLPAVAPGADADPGPGPEPAPSALLRPVRDLRQEQPRDGLQGRNVQIKVRVGYQRDDNQWIGADRLTVRVLDRETGPSDDLLYEGRTGSDGNFDVTVWSDENQPDLYLEFRTINGAVDVQDGTWSSTYKWETGVKEDFTGATADFGTRTPNDEKIRIALHLLTNVTRAWRWVYQSTGIDVPRQAVEWPSGDWPHYDPFGGDIHIPENIGGSKNLSRAWATDTHVHEFGHAVQNEVFDYMAPFDYDNGVCNNPNGDPGHCAWCQEDGGTALNEGWGNYLADQVLSVWAANYGIAPNKTRNQENLSACLDNQDPAMSCACDPYRTEGHFGRLLRDLTDDTPDEIDPLGTTNGQDLGAYGAGAVFQVMDAAKPQSPAVFIQQFLLFHALPAPGIYWSTLANNDYVLDDNNPPGVPPGLTSTDHAIGVQNPDATITMVWNAAGDDFSGVDRYQLQRRTAPSGTWLPAYEGPALTYTTPELAAGWYDFRIRTFDRAGNVSPFGQLGSFGIRDPYPADLTSAIPSGWDGIVVARSTNDATSTDCTVTPTLPGGTLGTYINWAVRNAGEQTTETSHITSVRIDGASGLSSALHPLLSAGGVQQARNRGPYTVRGGRHTVEAVYDAGEDNIEISETNNRRGRQFTWLGEKVNIAQRVRRPAPPDPTGGHSSFSVPIGQTKFKNCDGLYYSHLRTSPTIWTFDWAALWVAPLGAADDYDAMLHLHSTGTEDGGYTDGIATSSRPAGELDAVITQRDAGQQWDVGVINDNMGAGDYLASVVVSAITPLAVGDSAVITLGDSLFMAMRELTVPAGSAKTLVEVEIASGSGPLYTLWLDDTFSYGTISTYDGKVATDAQGRSKLTVTSAAAADHGLVFYRNPKNGFGALTFKVRITAKPSDPVPVTPSGWHSALVPRPAADGTAASVPAPASLQGESAFTHLNASLANLSDAPAGSFRANLRLDRTLLGQLIYPSLAAGAQVKANNIYPSQFPGGRRVLHLEIDESEVLNELNETNNRFGEQWVWTPPVSPLGTPLWRRGTNGGPVEAWESCLPSEPLHLSQDGLRTPAFSAGMGHGWAGVAVAPRAGSDVDLLLHEQGTGPTDGFDEPVAHSAWDGDATEFVLVNFGATAYRGFDAGVVRASEDTASYLANLVGSTLRSPATGIHGAFTLGPDRILDLHEFDLAAGPHLIHLVHQAGDVDWGLAAFAGPRPFQNRSDGEDVATSDALGPAGNEHLSFVAPAAGRYAVAVWKTKASEAGKSGLYTLVVDAGSVDAPPGGPPAVTRLAGARPSPFASATTVAFDLAAAADVELEVFDLRGARVRTLARGRMAPGRHSAAWDGADDAGRRAGPGVYLVRLVAGATRSTLKVVRTP